MTPVAASVNPQLTGAYKSCEPILSGLHFMATVFGPGGQLFRQAGRLFGVGLEGGHDIDPIQRTQMIKMNNVIKYSMGTHNQVTDILSI